MNCLANLSSDEIFTPPAIVNSMLDLLPAEIWHDKNATFLDPATKSGVFLREIAIRLIEGLAQEIPDLQTRLNHIFTKQVFGIAITEITALIARRTLYCSKHANSDYSVCTLFDDAFGNIAYQRIQHDWQNGKCHYCGANQENYDRADSLESHAYQFIHIPEPERIFNMKFDVIISNPPYQLSDGGFGVSASPLYHRFVQQAKKLNPRYLSMIIPARWYSGGKGLDDFRKEMLNDTRMSKIIDYMDSRDCFPAVDIAGGICYFLWDKQHDGLCEFININKNEKNYTQRKLNDFNIFIRDTVTVAIVRKTQSITSEKFSNIVSTRKPFGLDSKARPTQKGSLVMMHSEGKGTIELKDIAIGHDYIGKFKVFVSRTSYDHAGQPDREGKRRILSKIEIGKPNDICNETYLAIGPFNTQLEAENVITFLKTKFCRLLIGAISMTQDITKDKYSFVPMQDFNEEWTDEKLYQKYGLDADEIAFIESKIRPMELKNE